MAIERDWKRNHPKRGTDVNMMVCEMQISRNTLVYIGEKEGSGFKWIGPFGNVPELYRDKRVLEKYPRTVGYPGEILLIENVGKRKNTPNANWNFWNYEECDQTIPPYPINDQIHPEAAESLFIAIMRDSALEYKNDLIRALSKEQRKTEKGMRDVVKNVRMLDRQKIEILRGTSRGQYIVQRIEDEAVARFLCKDWDKMEYPDRQKYIKEAVHQMMVDRVKQNEGSLYAHIKRRSVKHE